MRIATQAACIACRRPIASSASNLIHAPAPFGNADAKKQRGDRPFIFTNLRQGEGVKQVVEFIRKQGLLDEIRH
jgi:hypothetical protein